MSIIGWLILGLIAGFIASKIVNKTGEGVVLDIVLGIVSAVVGGWLFATFGGTGLSASPLQYVRGRDRRGRCAGPLPRRDRPPVSLIDQDKAERPGRN